MKVKELSDLLKALPQDAEIMLMNEMGGFSPMNFVETVQTAFHETHSQAHYETVVEETDAEIISTVALLVYPYTKE